MKEDEVENGLKYWIGRLKPDIQKRFVYVFRTHPSQEDVALLHGDKSHLMGAVTNPAFNPPVITFYTDVVSEHYKSKDELKGLVTHEVLHVCGFGHGPLMDEKMLKNRLFKEAGEHVYKQILGNPPTRGWVTRTVMDLVFWWVLTAGPIKTKP